MSSKEELLISANTEEEISCSEISSEDFFTKNTYKQTLDVSEKTSFTRGDTKKENRAREGVPPRDISGWKWGVVVFSVLSSTFLFALDNSIVADVQPVIVTVRKHGSIAPRRNMALRSRNLQPHINTRT